VAAGDAARRARVSRGRTASAARCSGAARSASSSDKIDDINYKDVKLLMPFVPERAKILPRRISGTCALHQRKLRTAIIRARQLALIPYTAE